MMSYGWFQDPLFWVLIAFLLFVAVSFKPLKVKLLELLDKRQQAIRTQIHEAESILKEAQQLEKQAHQNVDAVELQAQEILMLAEQEIQHLKKVGEHEISEIRRFHQDLLSDYQQQLTQQLNDELRHRVVHQAFEKVLHFFNHQPTTLSFEAIEQALKHSKQSTF